MSINATNLVVGIKYDIPAFTSFLYIYPIAQMHKITQNDYIGQAGKQASDSWHHATSEGFK